MSRRKPTTANSVHAKIARSCKVPFTVSALATAVALPLSAAWSGPALAQAAALEEVMVTAQRRDERSQDVPISITILGSDLLGKGDVQQLKDIAKLTPALRFDNAGAVSQPTIRGIGNAVAVSGSTPNVGVYMDGFAITNPYTMDFDLLDVKSIEVLKGPQGTLFGRNSTGGAILVTTPEPATEVGGHVDASYGTDNTQRYGLYATGGVTDSVALDLGFLARKSDGYLDNTYSGSDTDGEYENYTTRVGAKWASERNAVVFRYTYDDREERRLVAANAFEDNGRIYSTADFYLPGAAAVKSEKVSNDYAPLIKIDGNAFELTYRADLNGALFTSLTQYRESETKNMMDFDFSSLLLFHYNFDVEDEVFSQEFLLSSQGDDRLQWTTGLYFFDNDNKYKNNAGASPLTDGQFVENGGSGTTTRSVAAFGDVTYQLAEKWYLTGGLRLSYDEVDDAYYLTFDEAGVVTKHSVDSIDDTRATPRVVLRYTPTDSTSVYVSYNAGYKAGILNVGGGTEEGVDVDPEEVNAYEVGFKYAGARMSFDTSVYYYDYTDLQVAYYDGPRSIIENAKSSTIYGADVQARYAVTDAFNVNVGAAYVNAEYDNFKNSQVWSQCFVDTFDCPVEYAGVFLGGTEDVDGFEMARSPKYTATLGFDYTTGLAGGTLGLSGQYYYTSKFYFDSSELYEQDSYDLLSLRADWTNSTELYTLSIFADNVTDSEYRTQVLGQAYGGLSMWGAPATVGAGVRVNF